MSSMKYLLKKDEQDKGVLCDKVTAKDGTEVYAADKEIKAGEFGIIEGEIIQCPYDGSITSKGASKVIATNNPNIYLPQVVDEVEVLSNEIKQKFGVDSEYWYFKKGYNKSQSTHPNSDEDMRSFADWLFLWQQNSIGEWKHQNRNEIIKTTQDLLQLWKSQQPKVIYYHA